MIKNKEFRNEGALAAAPQKGRRSMQNFVVSGYGGEKAIACYRLENGAPVRVWAASGVESPSFLCADGEWIFAASEQSGKGAIVSFRRQADGLNKVDELPIQGGLLCHLSYLPQYNALYGACYETGHVVAVQVENGRFGRVLNDFVLDPQDGEVTRAHCCMPDPAGQRMLVANIALDRVYCYNIAADGQLTPNAACPYLQLPKGKGPRHIRFHPTLPVAYVMTEYSSEILVLSYQSHNGVLKLEACVSTLPKEFGGRSDGSALVLSADGSRLYAANRGADTIAVFEVDASGSLKKAQDAPCGGHWPRHIELSKDGATLLIANQGSNQVVLLAVCPQTGKLLEQTAKLPFPSPSYAQDLDE